MEKLPSQEATAKVSSIFIYPVKSCRGITVSEAPITPTGFRWDRQWLVINEKRRAYTQRVEPKLACVEVQLPNEAFQEGWEPTSSSYLVLKAPGMDVLKISMSPPQEIAHGVSIWEWSGAALDEGADASKWFSDYLGKPSRLVRFNAASETRPVKPSFWSHKPVEPEYAGGKQIMFSDLFPYLIASQASLDTLNEHLKDPVPINRFRPNILVDGCEPFSEDLWTDVRINNFTFQCCMLCFRCKIPTVNQETGIRGTEPNETLKKFRSDAIVYPSRKQRRRVYFGQYLVCNGSLIAGVKGNVIKPFQVPTINQATGIAGPEPNDTLKKIRSDAVLRPTGKQQGRVYFGQNLVWRDSVTGDVKGNVVKVGDLVYVLKMVSSVDEAAA